MVTVTKIPIDLDRRRYLVFDFNAIAILHDRLGNDFLSKLIFREGGKTKLRSLLALRTFVFAGLQDELEESRELLTEREVGKLLSVATVPASFGAVLEAIDAYFQQQSAEGNAQAAGERSAASGSKKRSGSQSRT